MSKIVAVKIRGSIDARQGIQRTIENLGLEQTNSAAVFEDTESNLGMLRKAKDYIAYGQVSDEVAEKVEEQTHLSPPSGGLKSTKRQYNQGGSLGQRDDMENLLDRML